MLQWMGGSRRNVSCSRNSQHKRQKQYFEQRKRQQHKTAELQTNAEEPNIYQKQHRSLDILSLLNVEADDRPKLCPPLKRNQVVELNAPEMQNNGTEDPPTTLIDTVTPTPMGFVKHQVSGTPFQNQLETASPKKDPDCHISLCKGSNDKPDSFRTTTDQQFSVLDLLGNDGPNSMMEEIAGHEAHVAFSVEGLGKVGTETPVHSPQQPGRIFSYGCSPSLNGARKPNSLKKNHYSVMDELELEVDIDMALNRSSFDCSMNGMDSSNNLKQKLSTAKSSEQYDFRGYKTKSSFCDSYNIASNNKDIWDASSNILDDDALEEMECDLSWKNWSCQMDGSSAGTWKYRDNEMLGYTFEGPLLKKRNASNAADMFNISEPLAPYSKYQIAEEYYNCEASNLARWRFGFGEVTDQPYWTSLVKEDVRDSLSLLSEESCLSSAVRGEAYHDLPSYSPPQDNRRRRSDAFGNSRNKNNVKNIYASDIPYDQVDARKGHKVPKSGNCSGISNPSKSKPWNYRGYPFQENVEPLNSWPFEDGITSVDARSGFHSFSGTSDAKFRSSGSKPWTDDNLGGFSAPESCTKLSGKPKHGVPAEYSPSCSSFSMKCVFDQPFINMQSLDSPVSVGPIKADLFPDCAMHGMPLGSSHTSGSHGKTPIHGYVRKEDCISESQPISCEKFEVGKEFNPWNSSSSSENGQAVVASNSKDACSEHMEAKDGSTTAITNNLVIADSADQEDETSSSAKIPGQFECSLNDKEYRQDAKNPLPCQSPCEVKDGGVIEKKTGGERGDTHQVLLLESYVLQLLCVQKILKEASAQHNLKE